MIYLISAISQMLIAGTKPVLTLHASGLGATPAEIGIIVSVFALLPAFLAIHIGKWIDRYGIRRLVLLGGLGLLLSVLLPIGYPHFFSFVLSQALMGVAFTLQIVALQKRIGSTGDIDKHVATFSLVGSVGTMIGPGFSTFLYDRFTFSVSFLANGAIVLAGIGLVFLAARDSWEVPVPERGTSKGATRSADEGSAKDAGADAGTNTRPAGGVWSMLRQRDLRNAVLISGLMLSAREMFVAYFPLLGQSMDLSPTVIGVILSVMGAASVIIRALQPYLVRQFGRMTLLTCALYVSGIIYLLTPAIPWAAALTLMVVVLGAGLGLGHPLSLTYTIQVSPPDRRGEVLGLRITFNRISQFAVPLLFGSLGGVAGIAAIFWASGGLLLLGGWTTRQDPAQRKSEAVGKGTAV